MADKIWNLTGLSVKMLTLPHKFGLRKTIRHYFVFTE